MRAISEIIDLRCKTLRGYFTKVSSNAGHSSVPSFQRFESDLFVGVKQWLTTTKSWKRCLFDKITECKYWQSKERYPMGNHLASNTTENCNFWHCWAHFGASLDLWGGTFCRSDHLEQHPATGPFFDSWGLLYRLRSINLVCSTRNSDVQKPYILCST